MTNEHDEWATLWDPIFLAYVRYEEERKESQMSAFEKMPALVKGILGFHKCIYNGLRSYSREITILSPDKT